MENLEELMQALMAVMLIIGVVALILYILGSLGLMKIANKLGFKDGWMAWIPILNPFLLGKVASGNAMSWALVILTILSGSTATDNSTLGSLISFALAVLSLVALHKVYKKVSDKATVMTVFTVLSCGLLGPIFLFAIRNNDVVSEVSNTSTVAEAPQVTPNVVTPVTTVVETPQTTETPTDTTKL